jgi:hypothetical protein
MSVATISPNLEPLETNTPAFDVITTTNLKGTVWKFDSTTQEYLNGKFEVPPDIDTAGTVYFRAIGVSATAAASKNVAFDFDHSPVDHDEDLDSASYTTEASGDKATINNQNDLEIHEWSETVSNLGWAAEDLVFFRISREAAASNNLSGDWYLYDFIIEMPLA